ncbi:indole-3-glycerol phosphate synthase TrpC [Alloacidobacterium dinghuense]|uniref:Indole-3-glycerol phosphate synthase n=1 Tax=Alloacidobacterium dinghuense TaxID=2763107 RepID=A0A7G8BHG9_9BACT|nr:indole-3-glycerol phosphate synthase TrpC [Alloacidobacterium dinghuense]QNI31989.1 indole-3-glycerol phosphate synthase TrpC [Alloacidobacterium dinghuense]
MSCHSLGYNVESYTRFVAFLLDIFVHLERILAKTRETVTERKERMPISDLEQRAARHTPRGFAQALRRKAAEAPAVIAELKKASPSKGLIRPEFDVRSLAAELANSGAAALSVLTDEPFFQGSLENLEIASATVTIPCLRKDFMVDEYQIVEARAHGADAILLIVTALTDSELKSLNDAAHRYDLDVLCEVHSAEELMRARNLSCAAFGVNNRNLKTFEVRLDTALDLVEQLPAGAVHVAESGIHTINDMQRLRDAGYHGFLIGESLMRQPSPGVALAQLLLPAATRV